MKSPNAPLLAVAKSLGLDPATWEDFEQDLIQATVDFANMGLGLASRYEVEALFSPFARDMWVLARPKKEKRLFGAVQPRRQRGGMATLLTGEVFHERNCRKIGTYKKQQVIVRDALNCIVDGKGIVEEGERLNDLLDIIPFRLGLVDGALVYRFSIESVMQGWALGLVVLHESSYRLRTCENWDYHINYLFTIFNPKNHQQRYCSNCAEEMRRKSQAGRQDKYRQRKRLEKRGK